MRPSAPFCWTPRTYGPSAPMRPRRWRSSSPSASRGDSGSRPDARLLARELAAFADGEGVGALDVLERTGRLQATALAEPLETLVEARRATPA